jgi:alcohol dehydrogenase class IV
MNLTLRDLGVDEAMIPQLAEEAAAQWTARFNPVAVDAAMLEGVYRAAW